jgi:hypothetical protein
VEVVRGKPDLLEIVLALTPSGRFADFLHRRQEQPDQHGNDRNDH